MEKINIVISPSQQDSNKTVVKDPIADTEAELTRLVGTEVYKLLELDDRINPYLIPDFNLGDDMKNLKTAIARSNTFIKQNGGEGYHLDIHSDGGYAGSGASGFYVSNDGADFGLPIFQQMSLLTPWSDMSFAKRDNLAVLNQTIATAFLLEVSFHDQTEQAYWIFNNTSNIANAIVLGIYKGIGILPYIAPTKYIVPKWQYDSFLELVDAGVILNPELWKSRLNIPITVGECMAIINSLRRKK